MIARYNLKDILSKKIIEISFVTHYVEYDKNFLKTKLDKKLRDTMRLGNFKCQYVMSGRVAISMIGSTVKKKSKRDIALVPDYICNVVEKALRYSGFNVEVYNIREDFSINKNDLKEKLQKKYKEVGIVVLASIFGSQNSGCDVVDYIKGIDEDVHVLLDDAQNLISENESCYERADSVVFSFNKKNIPGYMGGVICLNENGRVKSLTMDPQPLGVKLETNILGLWIKSSIRELLSKFSINGFEYSTCKSKIFYRVDIPAEMSKLSMIFALNYLSQLKSLERRRKENWTRLKELTDKFPSRLIEYINTPLVAYSPYIPFDSNDIQKITEIIRIPIKSPYSLFDNPSQSLRPNTYAFVNYPYKLEILEK